MAQELAVSVLRDARRVVVKVGSSLVTNEGRGLDEAAIGEWCRQMAELIRGGCEVIMVSSGAIAEGMKRLGWATRPQAIHELQAAAAVGQMGLAQMYETKLRENGLGSAQVLLTHADLADRRLRRSAAARRTQGQERSASRAGAIARGLVVGTPRSRDRRREASRGRSRTASLVAVAVDVGPTGGLARRGTVGEVEGPAG